MDHPVRRSATPAGVLPKTIAVAVLLVLAGTPGLVAAQTVYKTVDAQGNVTYSDRAPTKDAKKTNLKVEQPDPAEVARLQKEQERLKAAELQRSLQQAVDDKHKAVEDHKRQAVCENARNRYFQLRESGRIFKRDTDGNRVYYSDSEAEAMREQARKAMVGACGS